MKTNKIVFIAFIVSAVLNIILAARIIYLQNNPSDFEYFPVNYEETTIEQETSGEGSNIINN